MAMTIECEIDDVQIQGAESDHELSVEMRRIRNDVSEEITQERELSVLRSRIATIRRVMASGPDPEDDPVVFHMIIDDFAEQLPRLNRRVNWLAAHRSTRRRW